MLESAVVHGQAMEAARNGEAHETMGDVNMQHSEDMPAREAEVPSAEAVVPSVSEDAVVPRKLSNAQSAKRGRHL